MLIDSFQVTKPGPRHAEMSLAFVLLLPVLLAFVAIAPFGANAASSFAQRAVLLSEGGAYPFVSLGDQDVPDLAAWEFDNNAHFTCVIGIWLLYDLVNYNANADAGVEYVFGQQYCGELFELGGLVSSVRPAGSRLDYTASTLTLYARTNFSGAQEYIETDLPSLALNGNTASLIVTGAPSEGWTLYQGTGFTQPLVCVFPPDNDEYAPGLLRDTLQIGIPHNIFASIRKGCDSRVKTARVPSVTARHGVL